MKEKKKKDREEKKDMKKDKKKDKEEGENHKQKNKEKENKKKTVSSHRSTNTRGLGREMNECIHAGQNGHRKCLAIQWRCSREEGLAKIHQAGS